MVKIMDIDALFRHSAFSSLEPEQLRLVRQFASDVQGRSLAEAGRMYRQLYQQISKIKPISATQRSAIVDALMGFVPEKDRQKFGGIVRMLAR